MKQQSIYTVGFSVPGNEFQFIDFNSKRSLLDADIILFSPELDYRRQSTYMGKPWLTEESSHETRQSLQHWRTQLKEAFASGKTIIVHLCPREIVYADTGRKEYSGTGRNARTTTILEDLCNYSCLPVAFQNSIDAEGSQVRFTKDGSMIKPYWTVVGPLSKYHFCFTIENSSQLLETASGAKGVAALARGKTGHIVFLPDFSLPEDYYTDDESAGGWSKKAEIFGKQLCAAVVELDSALRKGRSKSPPPDWVSHPSNVLGQEMGLQANIAEQEKQIAAMTAKRDKLISELERVREIKGLLYETGKSLEAEVIKALRTLGFTAGEFHEGDSQFDIVFHDEDGRYIGEAEGKDDAAVNIQKFQQLERNVQEDYARESVKEYAIGVLFGNPFRLLPVSQRKEYFTPKVITAAQRAGVVLVPTHALFGIVQYLSTNPDTNFAKACRKAFAASKGKIIQFPRIPEKG